jgi:hypothetical protein
MSGANKFPKNTVAPGFFDFAHPRVGGRILGMLGRKGSVGFT